MPSPGIEIIFCSTIGLSGPQYPQSISPIAFVSFSDVMAKR